MANLLLTPEEVAEGINLYYWSELMPYDTGVTRENYAVALAQIAKIQPLLAQKDAEIERLKETLQIVEDWLPQQNNTLCLMELQQIVHKSLRTGKEAQKDGE